MNKEQEKSQHQKDLDAIIEKNTNRDARIRNLSQQIANDINEQIDSDELRAAVEARLQLYKASLDAPETLLALFGDIETANQRIEEIMLVCRQQVKDTADEVPEEEIAKRGIFTDGNSDLLVGTVFSTNAGVLLGPEQFVVEVIAMCFEKRGPAQSIDDLVITAGNAAYNVLHDPKMTIKLQMGFSLGANEFVVRHKDNGDNDDITPEEIQEFIANPPAPKPEPDPEPDPEPATPKKKTVRRKSTTKKRR